MRDALWRVLARALLVILVLRGTAADIPADPRKPGTLRMVALLDQLAKSANPMANLFLSRERAAALRSAMSSSPTMSNSPAMQYKLGTELLAAGENESALAAFDRVAQLSNAAELKKGNNAVNLSLSRAVSYLRMAEQLNCLSNHNADSCLLPISGGGVHTWQQGSRRAIGVLTNLLELNPKDLSARWLLNVGAMTVGDYPANVDARWLIPPRTFESDYDIKRFIDVAGPAGLAANELSGASVVEDFDGDGFLDVLTTSIGLRDQMHFYHNNGDGTFGDRTAAAGLMGLTGGLNAISGDYNNDGFVDVLILRGAWMGEEGRFPSSLLKNNGDGTFEDVTEMAKLLSFHPTQTAVWFDFDGDGWLDLFIGNESQKGGRPHPCELYHNNRDGTFTEMAAQSGVAVRGFVKGVAGADYNNDGRPDLYLSIRGGSNLLYRNDGPRADASGWNFTEVGATAGVQMPIHSFPTWFFDYDNDGWEDLFVSGYLTQGGVGDIAADYLGLPSQGERAKLYHNRGDGSFEDVSREAHLDHVLHAMGANFGDLDNDGWLDFYLGTGDPEFMTIVPNRMFRNAGGKLFQDVTTSGGFGNLQKGHGVSFADLDNDGDQDVFENMGGAYSSDIYPDVLFLNPGHGNHWLKLQLVGVKANRSAIGARIKVTVKRPQGERFIYRTLNTGGSFGCNPLRQEIGLGDATAISSVEIRWPGSGTLQTFTGLTLDTCYRIREDSTSPQGIPLKSFTFPSAHSAHHHQGNH